MIDKLLWIIAVYLMMGFGTCFHPDIHTLAPSFQAANSFCIQDLQNNSSGAYFQNKFTKNFYFTSDGITVIQQSTFPSNTYK